MGCDYFYGVQADQFTFHRVPKLFFIQDCYRNMSMDAKLLYGMLPDRMNLSARNGWMDEKEDNIIPTDPSTPLNDAHHGRTFLFGIKNNHMDEEKMNNHRRSKQKIDIPVYMNS